VVNFIFEFTLICLSDDVPTLVDFSNGEVKNTMATKEDYEYFNMALENTKVYSKKK